MGVNEKVCTKNADAVVINSGFADSNQPLAPASETAAVPALNSTLVPAHKPSSGPTQTSAPPPGSVPICDPAPAAPTCEPTPPVHLASVSAPVPAPTAISSPNPVANVDHTSVQTCSASAATRVPIPDPVPTLAPASTTISPSAARRARVLGLALKFAFVPVGAAAPPPVVVPVFTPVSAPAPTVPVEATPIPIPVIAPVSAPTTESITTPELKPASTSTLVPDPDLTVPNLAPESQVAPIAVPAPDVTVSVLSSTSIAIPGSHLASETATKPQVEVAVNQCLDSTTSDSITLPNPSVASDPAILLPAPTPALGPGLNGKPIALSTSPSNLNTNTQATFTLPSAPTARPKCVKPLPAPAPASDITRVPTSASPAAPTPDSTAKPEQEPKPVCAPAYSESPQPAAAVDPHGNAGPCIGEAKKGDKPGSCMKANADIVPVSTDNDVHDTGNATKSPKGKVESSQAVILPTSAEVQGKDRWDWRDIAPALLSTLTPSQALATASKATPSPILASESDSVSPLALSSAPTWQSISAPSQTFVPKMDTVPTSGSVSESVFNPAVSPKLALTSGQMSCPLPVPEATLTPVLVSNSSVTPTPTRSPKCDPSSASDPAPVAKPYPIPVLGPVDSTAAHIPSFGVVLTNALAAERFTIPITVSAPTLNALVNQESTIKGLLHTGEHEVYADNRECIGQAEAGLSRGEGQKCGGRGTRGQAEAKTGQSTLSEAKRVSVDQIIANIEGRNDASVKAEDAKGKANVLGSVAHVFATSKEKVESQVRRGFALGSSLSLMFGPAQNPSSTPSPTIMPAVLDSSIKAPTAPLSTSEFVPNRAIHTAQVATSILNSTAAPAPIHEPGLDHSLGQLIAPMTAICPAPDSSAPDRISAPAQPSSCGSNVVVPRAPIPSLDRHSLPMRIPDTNAGLESTFSLTAHPTLVPIQHAQPVAYISTQDRYKPSKGLLDTREMDLHERTNVLAVKTGELVLVDGKLRASQKINESMKGISAVEVTRIKLDEGARNVMSAVESAEERFDLDFVAENPVRWSGKSDNIAFALGATCGRANERRVWRDSGEFSFVYTACLRTKQILAVTASLAHNSALTLERSRSSILDPSVAPVSASGSIILPYAEPSHTIDRSLLLASQTPVSDSAHSSSNSSSSLPPMVVPISDTERTRVHGLSPTPLRVSNPFLAPTSASVASNDSATAHTPRSTASATPIMMSESVPAPASAFEYASGPVYPTQPPASAYHSSLALARDQVTSSVTDRMPSLGTTPESTPASVRVLTRGSTPGCEYSARPASLTVPSPSRPRKYLYASRRSVPSAANPASTRQIVQDSIFAVSTEDNFASSTTSAVPVFRRAPAPAPIHVFTPERNPSLVPIAASTPTRESDSYFTYASAHTPAPSLTSASAFDDGPVQSGPDAMSALDSAIWAIDSAILALDMVSIIHSVPTTPQDPIPSEDPISAPAPIPVPTQTPALVPDQVLPQTPTQAALQMPAHSPDVAPVLDWTSASELALALSTELPVASPPSSGLPLPPSVSASPRRPSSSRTPSRSSLRVASAQLRHQFSGHAVKDVDFWR
ncbi:hypothetical protein FRC12_012196 [Ceratobasidium sp. 428]|nr:hypothetical protein FRC12_012196 [Ceratobasidium sp. 428]